MALVNGSIRPFDRNNSDLRIILNVSDWPQDVPLLSDIKQVKLQDFTFPISCSIYLLSDQTAHLTGSWFTMPYTIPKIKQWYRQHLVEQKGWLEKKTLDDRPKFYHPERNIYVVFNLSWIESLNYTKVMIRRGNTLPWPTDATEDYTERFDYAPWPFVRGKNWVRLEINPNLWPTKTIPLPPSSYHNTTNGVTHTTPHNPYWHFILNEENTIEVVGSELIVQDNLTQLWPHYELNLQQIGWLKTNTSPPLTPQFMASYQHPTKKGTLSFKSKNNLNDKQTQLSIKWTRKHPHKKINVAIMDDGL